MLADKAVIGLLPCCLTQDSNYFNLAIAPILRSMPQQKLRVLAELQVCTRMHAFLVAAAAAVEL